MFQEDSESYSEESFHSDGKNYDKKTRSLSHDAREQQ